MRWWLPLVLAIGCYVAPPAKLPDRRPLVTDQLPYRVERAIVRAWHLRNDWCLRRIWPSTDEFVICNHNPYLNSKTPAMYALVRYDGDARAIAYATFTPVPCRMYGRCDVITGRTVYASEHDFVDHSSGLYDHLADRGRAVEPHEQSLPSMQQMMFDALGQELRRRFGDPTWRDPRRYGMTWATTSSEIGEFVAGSGGWIVETHELRGAPPSLTATSQSTN
ncbi:MAG: hypothetical protein JWO36_3996 [Myxococcales bacterium]|nr:hypothetical protein [Myxococcales bacterium]